MILGNPFISSFVIMAIIDLVPMTASNISTSSGNILFFLTLSNIIIKVSLEQSLALEYDC